MAFRELYLEETDIPDGYLEEAEGDLYWENSDNSVFYLLIQDVLHKGREAVCYGVQVLPFDEEGEEWSEVMNALQSKGYESDGPGWESYLLDYINQEYPDLAAKVDGESAAESCCLHVMNSLQDYRALLAAVSTAVRELL